MSATDILDRALELPESDRARLAHQLLLSLDDDQCDEDWETAWAREINSRMEALEKGTTSTLDWREAIQAMRENLKARKKP